MTNISWYWQIHFSRAFRERNFKLIIDMMIRNNGVSAIPPEARNFLADELLGLLTGERTYPKHRAPSATARKLREEINLRYWELTERQGMKSYLAVEQVSLEKKKTEAYVRQVLKEFAREADDLIAKIDGLKERNAHPSEIEKLIYEWTWCKPTPVKTRKKRTS